MKRIVTRFPAGAIVAAAGLALVSSAISTAADRGSSPAEVRGSMPLLVLDRGAIARAAPSPAARPVARLATRTPLTGEQAVLPIVQETVGPGGGRWLRVRLPVRPNGATGWVLASTGSLASTDWEIVIRRSQRRALVLEGGRPRESFPVVVGKPSTPTPLGTFFVVEKLRLASGVAEGPWALATSAYSDVLQSFAGGPGQVALHGTVGFGDPLGSFSSHGCIRFAPAAISWIAAHVGAGTPVVVTR
jgi:lipoprotein-anchoring transpeptidase ErfK/SrfK